MLAKIHSRAQAGVDAPTVTVEVHLSNGLPALNVVGLPEAAVRESKDQVRSAVINSRFDHPARKLMVNLAPARSTSTASRMRQASSFWSVPWSSWACWRMPTTGS